jgi:hypothetical protein
METLDMLVVQEEVEEAQLILQVTAVEEILEEILEVMVLGQET